MFAALMSFFLIGRVEVAFKWLAALVILTLINELTGYRINPNSVYHIFTPVEYFFYATIYRHVLASKKWNKILQMSIWVLFVAAIINVLFFQKFQDDPTNTEILESLFLIILALTLFMKIRENIEYKNIFLEGVFWFNCAVLLYYTYDILLWGLYSLRVYNMQNPPYIINQINLLFSGLLYLVYLISILLNYRNRIKLNRTDD